MRISALLLLCALASQPSVAAIVESLSFSGSANDGAGSLVSFSGRVDQIDEDPADPVPAFLKFTLEIEGGLGDIRGFFFNVRQDADLLDGVLAFNGPDVTDVEIEEGDVSNLGGGANVNGLGQFDIGVEFGTSGASPDFIPSTMFWDNGTLTLADLFGQSWGFRAMSTGPSRAGSVKIGGRFPDKPDDPDLPRFDAPEQGTMMLVGLGLLAVGASRRRWRR